MSVHLDMLYPSTTIQMHQLLEDLPMNFVHTTKEAFVKKDQIASSFILSSASWWLLWTKAKTSMLEIHFCYVQTTFRVFVLKALIASKNIWNRLL